MESQSYIPHCILKINRPRDEATLIHCMSLAFNWANEMGLKGKKVMDLTLVDASEESFVDQPSALFCKIECTEEHRKLWESTRELEIIKCVYDQLKD